MMIHHLSTNLLKYVHDKINTVYCFKSDNGFIFQRFHICDWLAQESIHNSLMHMASIYLRLQLIKIKH